MGTISYLANRSTKGFLSRKIDQNYTSNCQESLTEVILWEIIFD
jgi:hypothetical protein